MIEFAEWAVSHFDVNEFIDPKGPIWEGIWDGETGKYTTLQLLEKYFEHLKQKQDATK